MGAFTACDLLEQEEAEVVESVLAIKSFSPTKVVPGQEMTIYGSCFDQISEIIFPENVTVSTSKLITNEVIKVVCKSHLGVGNFHIEVNKSLGVILGNLP